MHHRIKLHIPVILSVNASQKRDKIFANFLETTKKYLSLAPHTPTRQAASFSHTHHLKDNGVHLRRPLPSHCGIPVALAPPWAAQ